MSCPRILFVLFSHTISRLLRLQFNDVLGRGACKVVYKAFDTQEGTEVAWNQVRLSDLMATKDVAKEDRDRMFAEIRVLKALKHKNIMSFYDSWFESKTLTVNFITELFTSGTLRQYRKRHKHVDSEVLKRWAWQILCGLVYLHGHNPPIIHRDLKCDNIFINGSDGVVKIGDLGLATMLRSRTAPQSVLGTPEFMAPELYEEDYDDRVDVYSFGMALLELSTLEYPYAECTNAAQIYRKVSLGVRPQGLQKVTSPELAEFINTCIAPRASRPRARQLLKHAYFDTVRQTLAPCKSEMSLVAAAAQGTAGVDAAAPLIESPPINGDALAQVAAGDECIGELTLSNFQQLHLQQQQEAPSVTSSCSIGGVISPEGSLAPPPSLPAGDTASQKPGSDVASIRSQRSNLSELAAALVGLDAALPGTAGDAGSRMASRATSRAPSPPDSPNRISPTGSDQEEAPASCRCAITDRCFRVFGKVRSDEANRGRTLLNLRLRITEPDDTTRTVEFEFDLTVDTVVSVASEMVSDLELSPEDADAITIAMRQEISKLAAKMEAEASTNLENAAHALQQGIMENALLQANSTAQDLSDDELLGEDSATSILKADPRPPMIEVNGDVEAAEKWEDATGVLPTALSASSLLSEASVASAHSAYSSHSSLHSIQSSPAQLAGESMLQGGASGPPLATQRLTRTASMDRQLKAPSIG